MTRQNLIVIMSDEHNPAIMGCAGNRFVRTPNLDALAARGQRFSNAYCPSPICVPSRAAFATGMRVHQTRHWDNAMPYTGTPRSWGHVLQDRGIRVESIGKLHYRAESDPNGFDAEHLPMHVIGGHGMVWGSIRAPYLNTAAESSSRMLGDRIGGGESSYTRYDRAIVQGTLQWLQEAEARGEPFVLYVGLVAPHFPLIAPQEFFDWYAGVRAELGRVKQHPDAGYVRHPWAREYAAFGLNEEKFRSEEDRLDAFAAYYGLCSFLDYNVGLIEAEVERLGLAGSTHIVYTSDHGDNLGARGLWGKSTLYQESVGIPMIVAGPRVQPGVCDTPVDLLDLYPTILDAVGVDVAGEMQDRPGRSLFEIAAAPAQPERVILSQYHASGSNTGAFMLRKGRWKYHHYIGFSPELFDLQDDPEELVDRAVDPTCAAVLADMERTLRSLCDPEAVDALAKADQRALIEKVGGLAVAATMGPGAETPAPQPA